MAKFMDEDRDEGRQHPAQQDLHRTGGVGANGTAQQGDVHPEKPVNSDRKPEKRKSDHEWRIVPRLRLPAMTDSRNRHFSEQVGRLFRPA